jgi:hypothetical protein
MGQVAFQSNTGAGNGVAPFRLSSVTFTVANLTAGGLGVTDNVTCICTSVRAVTAGRCQSDHHRQQANSAGEIHDRACSTLMVKLTWARPLGPW